MVPFGISIRDSYFVPAPRRIFTRAVVTPVPMLIMPTVPPSGVGVGWAVCSGSGVGVGSGSPGFAGAAGMVML